MLTTRAIFILKAHAHICVGQRFPFKSYWVIFNKV